MLCTTDGADAFTMFLEGEYRFRGFRVERGANWGGLFIPDPILRVDLSSIIAPADARPGSVLRGQEAYGIYVVMKEKFGFDERTLIPAPGGVATEPSASEHAVCFHRWELGIFEGNQWKQLHAVDACS